MSRMHRSSADRRATPSGSHVSSTRRATWSLSENPGLPAAEGGGWAKRGGLRGGWSAGADGSGGHARRAPLIRLKQERDGARNAAGVIQGEWLDHGSTRGDQPDDIVEVAV